MYNYTNRNQLASVATGSIAFATYGYDLSGNLTSRALYNCTSSSFTYDAVNRLTNITHQFNGAARTFTYGYDEVNRRKYVQRDRGLPGRGLADGFGYDFNDQTTGFQRDGTLQTDGTVTGGAATDAFTFDANGNRKTDVKNGTATYYYSTNGLNQYSGITGVPAPTYDANGNLKTYYGWTYTYDALNRLTHVYGGSGKDYYFYYDGLNRQIARGENASRYFDVWDGWNLLAEYGGGNTLSNYWVRGVGGEMVQSLGLWYYTDSMGSTSHVTNNNGALVESYTYDLYGKPSFFDSLNNQLSTTNYGVNHLFTGQRWMPGVGGGSGLYDYRNRFMMPDIGRFLQPDPIGFGGGNNLYRYCGNNPANGNDANGLIDNHKPMPPSMLALGNGRRERLST